MDINTSFCADNAVFVFEATLPQAITNLQYKLTNYQNINTKKYCIPLNIWMIHSSMDAVLHIWRISNKYAYIYN